MLIISNNINKIVSGYIVLKSSIFFVKASNKLYVKLEYSILISSVGYLPSLFGLNRQSFINK